jgi:nitrate reductase gamma subunit
MSLNFNDYIPHQSVDLAGLFIAIVVAVGLTFVAMRWKSTILARMSNRSIESLDKVESLTRRLVRDALYQKPMAGCSNTRWFAHFAMFWGFIGLAATTTLDEIINPAALPLPVTSPVRILGNVTGILFVLGVSLSLGFRFQPYARKSSSRGDFLFLVLLLIAGLSGFTTEIFSSVSLIFIDGISYWLHIAVVAALLATAPFTKFVHAVGRPIILLTRTESLSSGDAKGN